MDKPENNIENLTNELKKIKSESCCGYLIIVDIKDSTVRKEQHNQVWHKQTDYMRQTFEEIFTPDNGNVNNSISIEFIVSKFLGDGMMVFYKAPNSFNDPNTFNKKIETTKFLFDQLQKYINKIHDDGDEILDKMRIRSVFTFITNVKILLGKKSNDIIGKGVDFAFRLERFADTSHIVINDALKNSIEKIIKTTNETNNQNDEKKERLELIPCKRKIKGWSSNYETFYIITSLSMVETLTEMQPTYFEYDVKTELFNYYKTGIMKLTTTANRGEQLNLFKDN